MIHWPVAFKNGNELFPLKEGDDSKTALDQDVTLSQTWEAVTKLPKEKTRAVGVSNFTRAHIEAVTKATGEAPACLQVRPRRPRRAAAAHEPTD